MKTVTQTAALAASLFLFFQCTQTSGPNAPAVAKTPDPVERGKYLVEIMGCGDCHSPKMMTPQGPAPDPAKLYSGHPAGEVLPKIEDKKLLASGAWVFFNPTLTAAIGPWGANYSANLTPDETGLGNWTLDQFKKAVREGKSKGMENGRMLLPPMPWQNYRNLSDDDAAAMFAYFKSIPAVKNIVPAPTPPAPM